MFAYWVAVAWPATGPVLLIKLTTISALILVAYLGAGEFGSDKVAAICTLARIKWSSQR